MKRKPNKVIPAFTKMINEKAKELLGAEVYDFYFNEGGYELYVVDQKRGRTDFEAKNVTVPKWCINEPKSARGYKELNYKGNLISSYWVYYLAHELSHVIKETRNHGADFMENFTKICPAELQFFELGYKPRNAKAAGISK